MEIVVLLLSAVACYFIATMIHELGHIVCGLFYHWKLFMLVVGPLKIYRETLNSKIKIGIERNIIMWCGVGGTLPIKKSEDNIKIWGKILLAGPITSIVFGLIILPFFVITKNVVLLMLCLMPIAIGVMCLIPMNMKTGLLYNDGTRYKRINNGGQEELEEKALFQLSELSILDGEDVIYPASLIRILLNSKDTELNYYGYYFLYRNAKRNSNLEEIELQVSNMKKIQNKVPKIIIEDCKIEH